MKGNESGGYCRYTEEELLELPLKLNVEQTAAILGWTKHGVQDAAKRGTIPAVKVGSRYMFDREDIFTMCDIDYERVRRIAFERKLIERKLVAEFKPLLEGKPKGDAQQAQGTAARGDAPSVELLGKLIANALVAAGGNRG